LAADTADVVVVGAGSAGCAVTRRLVDRGLRVVLLEAGGVDSNPAIHQPLRFGDMWFADEDWAYHTVEQRDADGRRLHWPRGRVIGGSSSLNAMIWCRGAPADYDHWAYLGNEGWSWADVLPVYRRMENFDGGSSATRGTGGPTRVMSRYEADPIHNALVKAAQEIGIPFNADYNSGALDGVSYTQFTLHDGQRHSAARAYLWPVLDRRNLVVETRARAHRLLFEGSRCVGVEWERDGKLQTVRAASEVIVCAGAVESPRLLLLSGLGDARHLREHGLEVRVHLPGVGRNLHDHLLAPVIFTTDRLIGRPSPHLPPGQTHLFWRSRPGLLVPDVQPLHFGVPMYQPGMTGPPDGFTLQAGIVRPASRGAIRLTGVHPSDELAIDPRAYACAADLDAMVAAVGLCRELGAASVMRSEWGVREVYPGPERSSPDELRAYARATTVTYHHQVGTCKMGRDADAVVDPQLRVYGVDGLRVADASIMPTVTTGNTNAPAILIGEMAAAFVPAGQE
jgi:choline dehydrogenase